MGSSLNPIRSLGSYENFSARRKGWDKAPTVGENKNMWQPDVLGPGFESTTLDLLDDEGGEVVATLVRYLPSADKKALPGTPSSPHFVCLALHGWNDYFYHADLARHIARSGGAFYALDLRRYGRSLREGHIPGFITDLADYDEDLHAARDVIFDIHGYDMPFVLYGHSTGGLTTSLWADRHPGAVDGLILNSPWLELQGSTLLRQISAPLLASFSKFSPEAILPLPEDNGFYDRLLSGYRDDLDTDPIDLDDPFENGGWAFDRAWRTNPSAPIRAGWLSAITQGHATVAQGLDITCPIITLTSNTTVFSDKWKAEMRGADNVLDVEQIWRRVPHLGPITTLIRLEGAIHDVLLSRRDVRDRAYGEIARWLKAYI